MLIASFYDVFLHVFATDTMTVKPATTRKLRRRPNDPLPVPEKRGKPSPDILVVHIQTVKVYILLC